MKRLILNITIVFLAILFSSEAALCNNLYFIENKGQWSDDIKYIFNSPKLNAYIKDSSIILLEKSNNQLTNSNNNNINSSVEIKFSDFNINDIIEPKNPVDGCFNFIIGRNPEKWKSGVRAYKTIIFKDSRKDIDLKAEIDDNLELTFSSKSKGANKVEVDIRAFGRNSKRQVRLIHDAKSESAQEIAFYEYENETRSYNVEPIFIAAEKTLSISPEFYSSFLGGEAWDRAEGITNDSSGNYYVVGYTNSRDFPVSDSAFSERIGLTQHEYSDVFVSKFSPSGDSLIFSTFIGGYTEDLGKSIAVDDSLNVYVTGYTYSTQTFPFTENAYDTSSNGVYDAFVFKLDSLGRNLKFSSFFGGESDDYAEAMRLKDGYVYITGYTKDGLEFPVTDSVALNKTIGENDVFIAKFNNSGDSLLLSILIGGMDDDFGEDLVIDSENRIISVGSTKSYDFPIVSNAFDSTFNDTLGLDRKGDVFLTIIDQSTPEIIKSTFFGGERKDIAYAVEVDSVDDIYITGTTESDDFPITENAYDSVYTSNGEDLRTSGDMFVTKFKALTENLIFSTYIGGGGADRAFALDVDSYKNVWIAGLTSSSDIPTDERSYDRTYNDSLYGDDSYIAVLDSIGSNMLYSTFLGGAAKDVIKSIKLQNDTALFFAGATSSTYFPVSGSPYSSTYHINGSAASDAFFGSIKPNLLRIIVDSVFNKCAEDTVLIQADSRGGRGRTLFYWEPSNWLSHPNCMRTKAYPPTDVEYLLIAFDELGFRDTARVKVNVAEGFVTDIEGPDKVYQRSSHTYTAEYKDDITYLWNVQGGYIEKDDSTNRLRVLWADDDYGIVSLTTINAFGCLDTCEPYLVEIKRRDIPKIIVLGDTVFCEGKYRILDAGPGFKSYIWSNGVFTRYDTVRTAGNYWVWVTDSSNKQYMSDTVRLHTIPGPPKPEITFNERNVRLFCITQGEAYRWYFNGDTIPGATKMYYDPKIMGWYKCEMFAKNGCSRFSDSLYLSLQDVEDIKLGDKIFVSPNPNDGSFALSFNINKIQPIKIQIYNAIGRRVFQKRIIPKDYQFKELIELQGVSSAPYFVRVIIGEIVLCQKIFIF